MNVSSFLLLHQLQQNSNADITISLQGPEEITVFHASIFEAMDGAGNKNTRSEWHDLIHPLISPIFSRTHAEHRARRQIWSQALSTQGKLLSCSMQRVLSYSQHSRS